MKHSSGVWLMPLSWWSSIHRSCQMRTVSFTYSKKKNTMTLHTFILSFFMFCLCCLYQMTSQNPQEWRELSRLSMPTCGPVSKWRMVRAPIQLPIALCPDCIIYLCVCMACDSFCLCLIGHNQGFGLMSSLVASRHNNPRSCQDPPVSGYFVLTILIYLILPVFQCVLTSFSSISIIFILICQFSRRRANPCSFSVAVFQLASRGPTCYWGN